MQDEKEMFIIISKQLNNMSQELKNINERLNRLECKTDDIHNYVPFVGWLQEVGQDISYRFKWLKNYKVQPELLIDITQPELLIDITQPELLIDIT
jgi:hypothetical protein